MGEKVTSCGMAFVDFFAPRVSAAEVVLEWSIFWGLSCLFGK